MSENIEGKAPQERQPRKSRLQRFMDKMERWSYENPEGSKSWIHRKAESALNGLADRAGSGAPLYGPQPLPYGDKESIPHVGGHGGKVIQEKLEEIQEREPDLAKKNTQSALWQYAIEMSREENPGVLRRANHQDTIDFLTRKKTRERRKAKRQNQAQN